MGKILTGSLRQPVSAIQFNIEREYFDRSLAKASNPSIFLHQNFAL